MYLYCTLDYMYARLNTSLELSQIVIVINVLLDGIRNNLATLGPKLLSPALLPSREVSLIFAHLDQLGVGSESGRSKGVVMETLPFFKHLDVFFTVLAPNEHLGVPLKVESGTDLLQSHLGVADQVGRIDDNRGG